MTRLNHAVGHGGTNRRDDVRSVQQMLNRHRSRRCALLKVDGIVGPKTMAAIRDFETRVVRLHPVDERIDPAGPTLRALIMPPHMVQSIAPAVQSQPYRLAAVSTARSKPQRTVPASPASAAPAPSMGHRDVVAWGAKVSPGFKRKMLGITARLQISPDFLMSCMASESSESFSPSVRNAAGSGATGLIQFMPSTAKALHTSTAELAAMTAERQLDYVERYFRPYKGRIRTIEDIYMTILYPKAIGQSTDYVLFSGSTKAYRQNRGLDADGDQTVNKYEAAAAVRAKYHKGLRPGYIG